MSEYQNATIVKKANIYFDGKVTSRTIVCSDGSKVTLGVMQPGEYEFGTTEHEVIEIQAGTMDVCLPGASDWKTVKEGDTFEVAANETFQLKVPVVVDYICSYS